MIDINQVSYTYPGATRPILHDLSFQIEPGEFLLVCGASGVGKSTLLRLLNGLVPHFYGGHFRGRIEVWGRHTLHYQPRDLADLVGSTEFIIRTIEQAPAGSTWGVGTELHLVNRLAAEHPDKKILFLSPMVCMCATMYRIDLPHLAWCLENLVQGTPVNRIQVDAETASWARLALDRMLQLQP